MRKKIVCKKRKKSQKKLFEKRKKLSIVRAMFIDLLKK